MTKAIFLLGFTRGGTNQFLNILRSHPNVFWPEGEFAEVFRSFKIKSPFAAARRLAYYAPFRMTYGDIFEPHNDHSHAISSVSPNMKRYLRACLLHSASFRKKEVIQDKGRLLELGLVEEAPLDTLLVKLVDYNVSFAPLLLECFPSAKFVCLVRDGRAVCEGQAARGRSIDDSIELYSFVVKRYQALANESERFRIFRFEDLLDDPRPVIDELYDFMNLDSSLVRGVHLQDKHRELDKSGNLINRKTSVFLPLSDVSNHFRGDVNKSAISRLDLSEKNNIEARLNDELTSLGYF